MPFSIQTCDVGAIKKVSSIMKMFLRWSSKKWYKFTVECSFIHLIHLILLFWITTYSSLYRILLMKIFWILLKTAKITLNSSLSRKIFFKMTLPLRLQKSLEQNNKYVFINVEKRNKFYFYFVFFFFSIQYKPPDKFPNNMLLQIIWYCFINVERLSKNNEKQGKNSFWNGYWNSEIRNLII